MTAVLDSADKRILAAMQRDSNVSTAVLAEKVGLSVSPCWRRLQRLRDERVILREVALLDRRKIGLNTQIFAQVRLTAQGRERIDEFAERIRSFPEVLECYVIMGAIDFLLRVVCADLAAYEAFLREKLTQVAGVSSIESSFSLGQVKYSRVLPI